jgi:hypothetical protein
VISGIARIPTRALEEQTLSQRQRLAVSVILYGILFAVTSCIAYWVTFSGWLPFDDEGYFDYSLKMLLAGHSIYSEVNSAYGPFYYEVFWLFFKLTGIAVTTSAGRMITVVTWVICSFCLGWIAHRVTRSLWLGLAVTVPTLFELGALSTSPMHAQIVVLDLTVAAAAVALVGLRRSERAAPAALGAIVGALILTKINLGGYAAIAVTFAVVLAGPRPFRRRWLMLLTSGALVAVAPVVMASELHIHQQRLYAIAVACSAAALALVAFPRKAEPDAAVSLRLAWWICAGAVSCIGLVLLAVVATGGSLGDWFQQTIIAPTHQATLLLAPLPVNGLTLVAGVGGVLCALAVRSRILARWLDEDGLRLASAAGRLAAGLAILVPTIELIPSINAHIPSPYGFTWALVWVAAMPPPDGAHDRERLGRVMLVALAISQSLMAYPVAGAQVDLGAMLLPLCGALCFADGIRELRRCASTPRWQLGARIIPVAVIALVVLLAGTRVFSEQFRNARGAYALEVPLTARGVSGIRELRPVAQAMDAVVRAVGRRRCTALMEFPGQYSFNLWSGVDTPIPMTGEQSYWFTLDPDQQLRVLRAAERTPRMCLITDPSELPFYTQQAPVPRVPLMSYLQHDFRPVAAFGDWQLEVPRPGR